MLRVSEHERTSAANATILNLGSTAWRNPRARHQVSFATVRSIAPRRRGDVLFKKSRHASPSARRANAKSAVTPAPSIAVMIVPSPSWKKPLVQAGHGVLRERALEFAAPRSPRIPSGTNPARSLTPSRSHSPQAPPAAMMPSGVRIASTRSTIHPVRYFIAASPVLSRKAPGDIFRETRRLLP